MIQDLAFTPFFNLNVDLQVDQLNMAVFFGTLEKVNFQWTHVHCTVAYTEQVTLYKVLCLIGHYVFINLEFYFIIGWD